MKATTPITTTTTTTNINTTTYDFDYDYYYYEYDGYLEYECYGYDDEYSCACRARPDICARALSPTHASPFRKGTPRAHSPFSRALSRARSLSRFLAFSFSGSVRHHHHHHHHRSQLITISINHDWCLGASNIQLEITISIIIPIFLGLHSRLSQAYTRPLTTCCCLPAAIRSRNDYSSHCSSLQNLSQSPQSLPKAP